MSDSFKLIRRCPTLGGEISFNYCETCGNNNFPCKKICDCWREVFDIERYLKDALTEEDFEVVMSYKKRSKISVIMAAAERGAC